MQATITYLLTEQAQRAQMVATGQPVSRKQTMTVDIAPEDLDCYPISADGTITVDLCGYSQKMKELANAYNGDGFDSPPDVPSIVRRWRTLESEIRSAVLSADESIAGWIDSYKSFESLWDPHRYLIRVAISTLRVPLDCPAEHNPLCSERAANEIFPTLARSNAAVDRWIERSKTLRAQRDEAARKDREARESQERTLAAQKLAYIADWIGRNAEPTLQRQFSDGLLCRDTALRMIADNAFAKYGVPQEHDTVSCDDHGCDCGAHETTCLPPDIYRAWKTVSATFPPDATAEFFEVRDCLKDDDGYCDGPTAGPAYYTASITIPVGPFKFERTIKL